MLKLNHLLKILNNETVRKLSTQNSDKIHKMQAWQIHGYGDLSELQLTAARVPHISNPSDLLIQVEAASLNPIDQYMIHGYGQNILNLFRGYELEFPLTLGRDFAGTVIDKGHGVNKFKLGDKVYGIIPLHKQGTQAQYVIADSSFVLQQPAHLSAVEATSILYAAMTAWSSLYITGGLCFDKNCRPKVLILGASGGVGTVAVQLLKTQKANVSGTCSTDAVPLVQSLGADNVFDYKSADYIEKVAAEGRYDIILDCAKFGYENIPKTWTYSKYITLNSPLLTNTDKYGLLRGLATSTSELLGANLDKCTHGKSILWGFFVPLPNGLEFVGKLIKKKQLTPTIHRVFKFNEVPMAYKILTNGHLRGKIVVDMQQG